MKDNFTEYYLPDFTKLWEDAIFVFDANVLLSLYSYSTSASKDFLKVLDGIKAVRRADRIWMPHQFAQEYHNNLARVIARANAGYQSELTKLLGLSDEVASILNEFETRSEYKIPAKAISQVSKQLADLAEKAKQKSAEHEYSFGTHPLKDRIAKLFKGKIGETYNEEQLQEIYTEGKMRFEGSIPPGYKDKDKEPESRRYGDLVGWKQIIRQARDKDKPIIMVSDDSRGDDWYFKHDGSFLGGPHPLLRKELRKETGQEFYLYRTGTFLERASDFLKRKVSEESIEEFSITRHPDEEMDTWREIHSSEFGSSLRPREKRRQVVRHRNPPHRRDFSFENLEDISFSDAFLRGIVFRAAILERIDFSRSYLTCAEFTEAFLIRCDFSGANLAGADLIGVRHIDCKFIGATLPDGEQAFDEIDMGRFTDIQHPEYRETRRKIRRLRKEIGCD